MTDDERPEAAVISLDEARADLAYRPIERAPRTSMCRHLAVWIDEHKRTLVCKNCECNVDPYAYIALLATEWSRYALPMKQMRAEAAELKAKLEETKRQERNARARLKRLKEKLGE